MKFIVKKVFVLSVLLSFGAFFAAADGFFDEDSSDEGLMYDGHAQIPVDRSSELIANLFEFANRLRDVEDEESFSIIADNMLNALWLLGEDDVVLNIMQRSFGSFLVKKLNLKRWYKEVQNAKNDANKKVLNRVQCNYNRALKDVQDHFLGIYQFVQSLKMRY